MPRDRGELVELAVRAPKLEIAVLELRVRALHLGLVPGETLVHLLQELAVMHVVGHVGREHDDTLNLAGRLAPGHAVDTKPATGG